jgi:hypothetical protein
LLVPLAALMMISNYAVIHFLWGGRYAWFSPYTWTGFLLVGLVGWTLCRKLSVVGVLGASLRDPLSSCWLAISVCEWDGKCTRRPSVA